MSVNYTWNICLTYKEPRQKINYCYESILQYNISKGEGEREGENNNMVVSLAVKQKNLKRRENYTLPTCQSLAWCPLIRPSWNNDIFLSPPPPALSLWWVGTNYISAEFKINAHKDQLSPFCFMAKGCTSNYLSSRVSDPTIWPQEKST